MSFVDKVLWLVMIDGVIVIGLMVYLWCVREWGDDIRDGKDGDER